MRKLSVFLFACGWLQGQTTFTPGGVPAIQAGGSLANLTVSIGGSTGSGIVAAQWSFTLPSGFSLNGQPGPTGIPVGNGAYCGPAQPTTNLVTCVVVGTITTTTVTPLSDGVLATIPISVAQSAAGTAVSIQLVNLIAVNMAAGSVTTIAPGAAYAPKILSLCDLNQDGQVDSSDVMLVIGALVSPANACPIAASNGGCKLQAVIEEIIAAAGGVCKLQ